MIARDNALRSISDPGAGSDKDCQAADNQLPRFWQAEPHKDGRQCQDDQGGEQVEQPFDSSVVWFTNGVDRDHVKVAAVLTELLPMMASADAGAIL